MNTIYYGHGAHGIEAASNYFFGKSAVQLSLAEASMLAGVPKGPTYYSPLNNLEKATDRQQLILKRMLDNGIISETDYNTAINEKLNYPVKDLVDVIEEGQNKISQLETKNSQLKIAVGKETKKAEKKEKQVQEMINSTSWKITGFLRKAKKLVSKY